MSHLQNCHSEAGPRFKVALEKTEGEENRAMTLRLI